MKELFTKETQCFIFNRRKRPIQGMLDSDFLCGRKTPSIAAIVHPTGGGGNFLVRFGREYILIPVYTSLEEAAEKHPKVSALINFASYRSVAQSVCRKAVKPVFEGEEFMQATEDALGIEQFETITMIAEGVPERWMRGIIAEAKRKEKVIIGPATVGGIFPGKIKLGNTGGLPANIIRSGLYRPGPVGLVTQSGGMLNSLLYTIFCRAYGVYGGVAIGGDAYPGSTFLDWLRYYEQIEAIKILVMLGEVGGDLEYEVVEALKAGEITKPLVVWCIGICATALKTNMPFGHAGSEAESGIELATAKNEALRQAGAIVSRSYDDFGDKIGETYQRLVGEGIIVPEPEPPVPVMPLTYEEAVKKGIIFPRKPTIVSSICDERGKEPLYAGVPISRVIEDFNIAGTDGLLWWKTELPEYVTGFMEKAYKALADHSACVAGADAAIQAARAGKSMEEAVAVGVLMIGPRFGGAIVPAAVELWRAYKAGLSPQEFVDDMRAKNINIPGIGHRIKSRDNPDERVKILVNFAKEHFPHTRFLDFMLAVEEITLQKLGILILNADGCIAGCMADALCEVLGEEEAEKYLISLNAIFIKSRVSGYIGHWIDQNIRLKQPLNRRRHDDVLYLTD